MVKLQGDFHFSFGTSTKRSEQPQGDFFARIALQREPCLRHLSVVDQSFNSWKLAVKLDLGEMCKLRLYFLSAMNTWLHIQYSLCLSPIAKILVCPDFPPLKIPCYTAKLSFCHRFSDTSRKTNLNSPFSTAHNYLLTAMYWSVIMECQNWSSEQVISCFD